MDKREIDSMFIRDINDWRVEYIGKVIRAVAEKLKPRDVDDESFGGRCCVVALRGNHEHISDFSEIHSSTFLKVYCVANGHNQNRITGITIEQYEHDIGSDIHDHTTHCETRIYRWTERDVTLAREILNNETDAKVTRLRQDLYWHAMNLDKSCWWDWYTDNFDTGHGRVLSGEIERCLQLAYCFPEVYFSRTFLSNNNIVGYDPNGNVIALLHFVDVNWFYEGVGWSRLIENCAERIGLWADAYCEVCDLSVENDRKLLLTKILKKVSYHYRKERLCDSFPDVEKHVDSKELFLNKEFVDGENKILDECFPWFELDRRRSQGENINLINPVNPAK